jgi:putative transposase
MGKRKIVLSPNEIYHVYNRGVDKRNIFIDRYDIDRFLLSMNEFNTVDPVGSIYELSFIDSKAKSRKKDRLVDFIAFCLNPNHFHFILRQIAEDGISKLMHRLGGGYTWYFNNRQRRNGVLFQGKFKAAHVDSNEYLLHLSAYVNLNFKVHQLGGQAAKLVKSSFDEYLIGKHVKDNADFCDKRIILNQFQSPNDYKQFAQRAIKYTQDKREKENDFMNLLLE